MDFLDRGVVLIGHVNDALQCGLVFSLRAPNESLSKQRQLAQVMRSPSVGLAEDRFPRPYSPCPPADPEGDVPSRRIASFEGRPASPVSFDERDFALGSYEAVRGRRRVDGTVEVESAGVAFVRWKEEVNR